MKRIQLILIIITAVTATVFGGTVQSVSGSVDVLIDGSWESATVGMTVNNGNKIMTGLSGSMTVKTTGGSFTVKPLSLVTYNEDTTETSSDEELDLEMGTVDVEFTKVSGLNSSFKVSTPKGTASIRGTREIVTYYPMSGLVVTVEIGHIDVSDNAGNTVPASKDQTVKITVSGDLFTVKDIIVDQFDLGIEDILENDTKVEIINDLLDDLFNDPGLILDAIGEPERL